jgi:hypothetical protein
VDNDGTSARDSIDINSIVATPASVVYANTEQEVLVITKDKLHLCLQRAFRRTAERDRWLIPLGVLVPLVLAVVTSGYTKRFGLGGGEWETIFIMLIIFTIIWLVRSLLQRGKSMTADQIIEELAKNPVMIGKAKSDRVHAGGISTSFQVESQKSDKPTYSAIVRQDSTDNNDEGTLRSASSDVSVPRTRPVPELSPGDIVTHDRFGLGTVVSVDGHGDRAEAKIDFGADFGVKHLVLRYSPLAKL